MVLARRETNLPGAPPKQLLPGQSGSGQGVAGNWDINMAEPLCEEEKEVLAAARFSSQKKLFGRFSSVCQKPAHQPQKGRSCWYLSQEIASRAIWLWAGEEWVNKVERKDRQAFNAQGPEYHKDLLSGQVRQLRELYVQLLSKELLNMRRCV